jgi:hypothetical protein
MRKAHSKAEPSIEAASPFALEPLVVSDTESWDPIPSGEPSRGTEDIAEDGGWTLPSSRASSLPLGRQDLLPTVFRAH